jgi:hypothetical protein
MVKSAPATTMSISNNNRERSRTAIFSWSNSGSSVATVSIIIALTLLSSGFVLLGPATPMTTTTVLAQEENNTTTAGETTTTTTSNTTTTPSGIELSPQPIWEEQATTTGMTQINETHRIVSFIGNGTLTVPDTGQTINMTNNGSGLVSPVAGSAETVSAYGKENVLSSEDGDSTAITFHEIIRYDPTTLQGKGFVVAVFDGNATGSLAPFNGMFVVGTHEEDPNAKGATITLWEW